VIFNGYLYLLSYFRRVFYLIVLIGYSLVYAGSYEDFFKAIKENNAAAVTALLQRGFDVNAVNPAGEHGLLLAFREPHLKVAHALMAWPKVTAESRSAQDESPLMLAALHGLLAECQTLIQLGADVNKPGWTPLHYAATRGHLAVMNLLLDEHAYIDAASPNGTTPLMMAAHYGTASAVKLLLEADADPTLKNDLGLSAFDFAHSNNKLESAAIISAFIRGRHPKGIW
jgi:ankyrin repeat protein